MLARRPRTTIILATLAIVAAVTAAALIATRSASATPTARAPVVRQCRPQHLLDCRRAVAYWRRAAREAQAAVEWQKRERVAEVKRAKGYGVMHAVRLASAVYGIPLSEMVRVGSCESHLTASSKNRHSTAAGVFQFLDSTWARAGVPGFSVYDPYANALAAARLVQRDGSWREWQCRP